MRLGGHRRSWSERRLRGIPVDLGDCILQRGCPREGQDILSVHLWIICTGEVKTGHGSAPCLLAVRVLLLVLVGGDWGVSK